MSPIPFDQMPWEAGAHPLERKKACGAVALLEFAPGFADPNWCSRAHVFLVLQGRLTLEFAERTEVVSDGQAFVVAPGVPHRARNDGDEPTRLFVVSDVVLPGERR